MSDMPDHGAAFVGERVDELNRMRKEFPGWTFAYCRDTSHPWEAQRRHGLAWHEGPGGIVHVKTVGPVLLRELVREAELLDVRYRDVRQ